MKNIKFIKENELIIEISKRLLVNYSRVRRISLMKENCRKTKQNQNIWLDIYDNNYCYI